MKNLNTFILFLKFLLAVLQQLKPKNMRQIKKENFASTFIGLIQNITSSNTHNKQNKN